MDQELPDAAAYALQRWAALRVQSSGDSTFSCEMTSWPPS